MNIRNPNAHKLAAELARLTGESMTVAVIHAIGMRLEAERRDRQPTTTADRILAFAGRVSADIQPGLSSSDHAPLLYDDSGVPR